MTCWREGQQLNLSASLCETIEGAVVAYRAMPDTPPVPEAAETTPVVRMKLPN